METPKTLAELKAARKKIHNVNAEHKDKLSWTDKLALAISDKVGSMGFFFIILVWTLSWLLFNSFAPVAMRFDPFPAFVLWLFMSNMIQIFLMPMIMVGQNLQSRHSEARAEADFEVNVKAEREIEAILLHLENQNKLILQLLEKQKE